MPKSEQTHLVLLGTISGLLGGLCFLALQTLGAVAADVLWTVRTPWFNLFAYPAIGAVACTVGTIFFNAITRRRLSYESRLAWVISFVALAPYALRSVMTAERAGNLPAAAVTSIGLLGVVWLGRRLVGLHVPSSMLTEVGVILALLVPSLTISYFLHVCVMNASRTGMASLLPRWTVVTMPVAGVVALALSMLLLPKAGVAGLVRRLVGAALVVWVAVWGVRTLQPEAIDRPTATEGPNVLVMVLDTLRRDAVSAYGVVDGVTPNLDAFAEGGVLFEDAISPGSWTIPGHASIFTGAEVTRHGSGRSRWLLQERPAGPETTPLPTIAEIFSRNGWRTAAFVCNGQLSRANGFSRGFERYHELWKVRSGDYDLLRFFLQRVPGLLDQDKGGRLALRGLEDWFADNASTTEPWLAFVNFLEPHNPYEVPVSWAEAMGMEFETDPDAEAVHGDVKNYKYGGAHEGSFLYLWTRYLAAVAYQDYLVGRTLEALAVSGHADDTIVVITSDHGENFGWDGLLLHGQGLNDDLIRVPLILAGPGVPAGVRSGYPASVVDILPTSMHLAGIDLETLPRDPGRTGIVLSPIAQAPDRRLRLAELWSEDLGETVQAGSDRIPAGVWGNARAAVLLDGWKLEEIEGHQAVLTWQFEDPHPPIEDGRHSVDNPDKLEELLQLMRRLRATWPPAISPLDQTDTLDAETRRQLEALGYL